MSYNSIDSNFGLGAGLKTAGIAVDTWKVPIFKKILLEEGYSFTLHKGVTKKTKFIKVTTSNLELLKVVVQRANTEASKNRK